MPAFASPCIAQVNRDYVTLRKNARSPMSRRRKEKGAAKAPLSQVFLESYFGASLASAPSFGAPVPDEPMNSLRPSGKVTSRPLALQIGVQARSFDW